MKPRSWWMVSVLLAAGMLGCHKDFGWPFQRQPGTMQQQRLGANYHDPYADQDAGPEVVGGRPRDFQKPLAEAARSQPKRNLP
jgi:hypothetical protein